MWALQDVRHMEHSLLVSAFVGSSTHVHGSRCGFVGVRSPKLNSIQNEMGKFACLANVDFACMGLWPKSE